MWSALQQRIKSENLEKEKVGGKNKAFSNPWLDYYSQLEGFIFGAWPFLFWPSSQGHVSGGLYFPKAVTQSIRSYELDHQAFVHLNFWATIPYPPPHPPALTHDMMPLPLTGWEGRSILLLNTYTAEPRNEASFLWSGASNLVSLHLISYFWNMTRRKHRIYQCSCISNPGLSTVLF